MPTCACLAAFLGRNKWNLCRFSALLQWGLEQGFVMRPRWCRFALVLMILSWPAAAAAQSATAVLVGPTDPTLHSIAPPSSLPDFRMPRGDYRQPPGPVRNGLLGAVPLRSNLQVAVGRFMIPEVARPRTHMEHDARPADVRRRDRGMAAVGFSLRF